MILKDQVKRAMHLCMGTVWGCSQCPYDKDENGLPRTREECTGALLQDWDMLISDMENAIKLLEEEEKHDSTRVD